MMGYGAFGPGAVMGGLGWIWMVVGALFWVGVVLLLVWGAAALVGRRPASEESTALEILRRRYARSEISEAEFEQAKRVLA